MEKEEMMLWKSPYLKQNGDDLLQDPILIIFKLEFLITICINYQFVLIFVVS